MALGKSFLDLVLTRKQPVHCRIELVLVRTGNTEIICKRRVGPRLRHAELARLRRNDAAGDHSDDEITLAAGFRVDELVESEPFHGGANRLDVAMVLRADAVEPGLDGSEPLAFQYAADHLDLIERQRGKIGDLDLPDAVAVSHAIAQQIGRRRIAIGDLVDVHDAQKHDLPRRLHESLRRTHDYKSAGVP